MITIIRNALIDGDPMEPSDFDLITQQGMLNVNEPVPEGWRVLTGNIHHSVVARVVYRYEIEEDTA
jgi:hypothetical protein